MSNPLLDALLKLVGQSQAPPPPAATSPAGSTPEPLMDILQRTGPSSLPAAVNPPGPALPSPTPPSVMPVSLTPSGSPGPDALLAEALRRIQIQQGMAQHLAPISNIASGTPSR